MREDVFGGGPLNLRTRYYLSRFKWFQKEIRKENYDLRCVIELGSNTGRLIDYFPKAPGRYVGFDEYKNTQKLKTARNRDDKFSEFRKASSADQMKLTTQDKFTLAVCMETLEHIPPRSVGPYLQEISDHLDGYFIITIPNEKGILFLPKWLIQTFILRRKNKYSLAELFNAAIGRTDRVERDEHKGFNWEHMLDEISKYYDIVSVNGIKKFLPSFLSPTICIIAKSR